MTEREIKALIREIMRMAKNIGRVFVPNEAKIRSIRRRVDGK